MKFLIILFIFLVLNQTGSASPLRATRDCFIPGAEDETVFFNCYSMKPYVGINARTHQFPLVSESQRKVRSTSFYISLQAVSLKEYWEYMESIDREIPAELVNLNRGGNLASPIQGITWDEARDYCFYYGQNLPSEAHWEIVQSQKRIHQVSKDRYEWTRDFYKYPVSNLLPYQNPVELNPSGRHSLRRRQSPRSRIGLAPDQRRTGIHFRCVSKKDAWGVKEILLDYKRIYPQPEPGQNWRFLKLDTKPGSALVHQDLRFLHALGATPFHGRFKEEMLQILVRKKGFQPEVLHLKIPEDRALYQPVKLKPIPPRYEMDKTREQKMVLVDGGKIKIGLSEWDRARIHNEIVSRGRENRDLSEERIRKYLESEGPDRFIYVSSFYMDQNEVTNAQFERYLRDSNSGRGRCQDVRSHNKPDQPVVCVDWLQANSYCRFYGLALPSEVQFEKASKGVTERGKAAFETKPRRIRMSGGDHSRYDIYDLLGNVMEWTRDWYDAQAYENYMLIAPRPTSLVGREKVIRGGSYASHRLDQRISKRRHKNPEHYALDLGFRCIRPLN